MATRTETLWTVARIAAHLEVARHRVEYIIETRGIIPIDRAGIARVFSQPDIDLIANELRRIVDDRKAVARG